MSSRGGKSNSSKNKKGGSFRSKRHNNNNNSSGKSSLRKRVQVSTRHPNDGTISNQTPDQVYVSPRNKKLNGQKGAESHTVAESSRIELSQLLASFRENEKSDKIELPSTLTNTERKFIHEEARRVGLLSKSHGKGENRRITISKLHTKQNKYQLDTIDDADLPNLDLGKNGNMLLFQHIQKFPRLKHNISIKKKFPVSKPKAKRQYQNNHTKPSIPFKVTKKLRKKNKQNSALPIETFREDILSIIENNPITILTGDTGCGKSTQLPQFILGNDPVANIIITQPRRISAISLADRISWELSEELGNTVGYKIRMDSVSSSDRTRIMLVTPGILLQKLESLDQYTHIILDEIHERDQYTEFLMMALRQKKEQNELQNTKLILMSATMPDRQQLIDYWNAVSYVGEITVPGRMYPVQDYFLENILEMVKWEGADWQQEQEMVKLDKELAQLVGNNSSGNTSALASGNGLVCVMCQRKGFASSEELGTHVALCDGNISDVVELEERVRNMSLLSDVLSSTNAANEVEEYIDYGLDNEEVVQENPFDEDENLDKWDGHSPFYAVDSGHTTNSSTLTQEKLLSQYQVLNDDDQVDEILLLSLLKFLIQSSFGDGAILIFFAGWNEIISFQMLLKGSAPFCNNNSRFQILPLHSGVNTKEQKLVFQKVPSGVRKIVLATNIAETSVTIDDVSFVVDTGRAKEKNYDPHLKTSTLQPVWISKASAKQRKGRAGRTKPGVCFRMYSRRRFSSFRANLDSELLRTPLEQVALQCKKLNLAPGSELSPDGIPAFLAKAITPPHPKSISNAIGLLIQIGAMVPESNELTNLGMCLSQLSLEPRVGKMVLWSHILGCARGASSMAVAMSNKSPFVLPTSPSMRKNAALKMISLSNKSESDLMTILNALRARDNCSRRRGNSAVTAFCNEHFLSYGTMQMIADLRRSISRELVSIGFPPSTNNSSYHNRFGDSDPALLQASIAAGLYPNIAMRTRGDVNFYTPANLKAKIHISSVNACQGQRLSKKCNVKDGDVEFVLYSEMVKGVSNFTMSQTTRLSSPLPLLILCGEQLKVRKFTETSSSDDEDPNEEKSNRAVISLDDWVIFQCNENVASVLVTLRERLEKAFSRLIQNPSSGFKLLNPEESDAINTACLLLKSVYSYS